MSRAERYKDVADTISHLAARSFEGFQLTYDARSRSWKCRHPAHGNHAFRVYLYPGLVVMWGDLGEYVFVHGDMDSLRWFLDQGRKEEKYPDYFLSKLRAIGGSTAKEFYVGDAYSYLDERIAEIKAVWNAETADLRAGEDDEDIEAAADDAAKAKEVIENVRSKFKELVEEEINDESGCWYLAWSIETGDGDPPECEGWTGTALWAWHAVHVFARLYAERAEWSPTQIAPNKRAAVISAMRSMVGAPDYFVAGAP